MWFLNSAFRQLTICLCILASLQRSFVEPTPVNTSPFPGDGADVVKALVSNFDEVQQLEHLKQSWDKTFSVLKSHSALQEAHEETREDTLQQNATPDTHVRTELKIPANDIQNQRQASKRNRLPGINQDNKYSMDRVQYSPRDMAEYVFWTGDEKRVTLAIEEFLQAGQMSREEAISFLQDIKANLDYLETHYSRQDMFRRQNQNAEEETRDRMRMMQQQQQYFTKPLRSSNDDYTSTKIDLEKKNARERPIPSSLPIMQGQQKQDPSSSEDDFNTELLERLKAADYLYTEYSLEEVIYQLAKVMFAQSITRGSNEAQEALQTFTNYLTAEADMGRISKSLQKKVLDVLIASLTDTLAEHPQAMTAAMVNLAPKEASTVQSANMLLHQILMLNPRVSTPGLAPKLDKKLNAETVLGEHQSSYYGKQGDNNETEKPNPVGKPVQIN